MNDIKIPLGILQRISEFLAELPEDQVEDLATGRARLAYVPVGETEPVAPSRPRQPRGGTAHQPFTPSPTTTELLHRFETIETRAEAATQLTTLKKAALLDIARALSIPGASKLTVPNLRTEIVESTVGRRLDSVAIRGFDGSRP
jgi:hypothetical protein